MAQRWMAMLLRRLGAWEEIKARVADLGRPALQVHHFLPITLISKI
jgi:hypothetical protein